MQRRTRPVFLVWYTCYLLWLYACIYWYGIPVTYYDYMLVYTSMVYLLPTMTICLYILVWYTCYLLWLYACIYWYGIPVTYYDYMFVYTGMVYLWLYILVWYTCYIPWLYACTVYTDMVYVHIVKFVALKSWRRTAKPRLIFLKRIFSILEGTCILYRGIKEISPYMYVWKATFRKGC